MPGLHHDMPYMHNGMISTLADVVEFYNNAGGKDNNKSKKLQRLGLSSQEKKDLVAFLESLSGDQLTGPAYVWDQAYPESYPAIENWTQVRN